MKKVNIVKEKKDFDSAFKKRNQVVCKYAYIYINDNDLPRYRFGICVSKKIGNAVTRNKYKRRVKDIIDKSQLQFSSKDYIIILRKSVTDSSFLELKEELVSALSKITEGKKNNNEEKNR